MLAYSLRELQKLDPIPLLRMKNEFLAVIDFVNDLNLHSDQQLEGARYDVMQFRRIMTTEMFNVKKALYCRTPTMKNSAGHNQTTNYRTGC